MLKWWSIMLDVVDTPYRGGVLCLRGGALFSASVLLNLLNLLPGESERTWDVWRTVTSNLAIRLP